tara:strand:+ start:8853 stop:9668 length:816 start_codon:yes stop_codon:yes gene_type:complete
MDIQEDYQLLMSQALYKGKKKTDRTGTGTLSLFGKTIEHDMSKGFPLLTTKKVWFNAALTEILWILQGRTDIGYLHEHKVHYWDADYERSGRTDMTLGPVYGKQWRDFGGVDQLKNLLIEIKSNPDSRRLIISAWNPIEMNDMVLPPCHYGFQVYINDGVIDLMWQQRSVDIFLGLPYDIAMYGLLLEFLAKGNKLKAGKLIGQLGDCHLYSNHLGQASEQLERYAYELPTINVEHGLYFNEGTIFMPVHNSVSLNNYKSHPPILAPLSVG